jgi:GntR family transcriptional regulator
VAALHQRIAADLRSLIHDGTLKAGARLPTEHELMIKYGTSRTPVRQALATLANEGLIETATSRGTFVRQTQPLTLYAARYERGRPDIDAHFSDLLAQGRPIRQTWSDLRAQGRTTGHTFEMKIVPASAAVALRLQVEENSLVVERRRVRMVDDKPSSIEDSYYPYDIAERTEILSPSEVEPGTIAVLASAGHVEIGYVDEIRLRTSPTEEENRLLQLGAGMPVLHQIRTGYTTQRPVRLTWNIWAGDGIRLVYELGDLQAVHDELH